MQVRPWTVASLAAIALPALWLLLAGPEEVLGFDAGKVGVALLVTAAWTSLLALSWMPRSEAESSVAPGEWEAWIGTGFMLIAITYFISKVQVFQGVQFTDPGAHAVGRNLVLLLIAWAVLSSVMSARWKGTVHEDERDREIAVKAAAWGRGGLMLGVVVLAVMLTFSPPHKLAWASHLMIANLLMLALMAGWLCEHAASALIYWRGRS